MLTLQRVFQETDDRDGQPVSWHKVLLSPAGDAIYGLGSDHRIRRWSIAHVGLDRIMGQTSDWIDAMALSPDGAISAVGSIDHWIVVWDLVTNRRIHTFEGHEDSVMSLAFSSDGRTLASGDGEGVIILWDLADGHMIRKITPNYGWIRDLVFRPNKPALISSSIEHYGKHDSSGTLKVWDIGIGEASVLIPVGFPVESVAVDPDGKVVASASWDGIIKLWDIVDGHLISGLRGHEGKAYAAAYSPNGKTIATGGEDMTIRIWDVTTGMNLLTIQAHSGSVMSIAFNDDGQLLASASMDGTIKLWEVAR